jgi:uncharacterized membrane protein YozB (DUF420 family)
MALLSLAIVFVGFSTSYFLWPITRATHYWNGRPIRASFHPLVHVHAALFTAWILLFVGQVLLVTSGRTAVHRRIGLMAAWLFPVLIVTGWMTGVQGARDGWSPAPVFVDPLSFLVVPLLDIVVFAALGVAGFALRHRRDAHKRLMLFAVLGGLMWPAITRMPFIAGHFLPMFGLFLALIFAPVARDFWMRSRSRRLSLWVALGLVASVLVRPAIGATTEWRAFAAWLVG